MAYIDQHLLNIHKYGMTIIRNGVNLDLVDKVVEDFDNWSSQVENNFVKFNYEKVCNFHIQTENTMDLVTNIYVDQIISAFFNKEQVIYTSLFFREGTGQGYYRDTPHFYTNPINQYCGAWYALEDIDVDACPFKYCLSSHLIDDISGHNIYNSINMENMTFEKHNFNCLITYNKKLEEDCIKNH